VGILSTGDRHVILLRLQYTTGFFVFLKPVVSPTCTNFGKLLKSCDIILSIDVLTCFPILPNQVFVKAGLAEVYQGKPPRGFDLSPYLTAEAQAKSQRRGMWEQENYISPKDWRKAHKK